MESLFQEYDSLEMNELHRAVENNEVEAVKYLVDKGADITNTINKGQTPLHLAVKNNYEDIMIELCKNKSRGELRNLINRRTLDTGTATIHLALRNNSLESTKFLLSRGANLIEDNENIQLKNQITDNSILQLIDHIEEVFNSTLASDCKILLEKLNLYSGERFEPLLYARNRRGFTSLQLAMEKNQLDAVATIVNFRIKKIKQNPWQAGAKLDKLMRHYKAVRRNLSNLDLFCYEDQDELAVLEYYKNDVIDLMRNAQEFLEDYKKQRDPSLDEQPMLIIIEESLEFYGSWKASKFIENKRFDTMMDKGPMFIAKILKICIMVPMQFFMRLVCTSELLQAADQNNLVLVQKCLTGHPDMNEKDANNRTALRHAFEQKNYEMAKMLLKFGADPTHEKQEYRGGEPLLFLALNVFEADLQRQIDIMQLLFDRVSDDKLSDFVSVKSGRDSTTVLHWASRDVRFLQFFMSKGAIYCAKDKRNVVPKDYFCRHRRKPTREMFDHVDQLFNYARKGRAKDVVQEMKKLDLVGLLAVGGTRNEQGQTLIQILEVKGHADEAAQIRKLLSSEECEYYKRNVARFFSYGTTVSPQ